MQKIAYIMIVLTVLLLAHLIEEIKAGFRIKFPLGRIPKSVFVLLNIAFYSFAFASILLAFYDRNPALLLAWIYAILMLLNGTVHIAMMVVKRGYYPGGITALALLPVAIYLAIELAHLPN